jgi:hypothetical protein
MHSLLNRAIDSDIKSFKSRTFNSCKWPRLAKKQNLLTNLFAKIKPVKSTDYRPDIIGIINQLQWATKTPTSRRLGIYAFQLQNPNLHQYFGLCFRQSCIRQASFVISWFNWFNFSEKIWHSHLRVTFVKCE